MGLAISRNYMRQLLLSGDLGFRFEEMLKRSYSRWISQGDVAVDVGAHDGLHTRALLDSVCEEGKVFAFEPLPGKYSVLCSLFSENNVFLMNSALSNQGGVAEFVVVKGDLQKSGLLQRDGVASDAGFERISVEVGRMDDFLHEMGRVAYIKIDVEGAEINCLLGAQQIIEESRPLISCEYGESSYVAYGCTAWSLYDFCCDRRYVIYDIFLNRLSSRLDWQEGVDSVCWDYFLVPAEREIEFVEKVVLPERRESAGQIPLFLWRNFSAEECVVKLLSGFSCSESWGVWTDSEKAVMTVSMPKHSPNGFVLNVFGRGYAPREGDIQEIEFFVMDEMAGTIRCCHSEGEDFMKSVRLSVPENAVKNGSVEVLIHIRHPLSPLEAGVSGDTRRIGFALHGISARELNSESCIF